MNPGLGSLLALLGVIALIPLCLWALKRTPLGGGAAQGPMKMVGMLALTPAQRLVTVEVGQGESRRWLVLAVGPTGVSTLHTMAPQGTAAAMADEALPAAVDTHTHAGVAGQALGSFARLLAAQRTARAERGAASKAAA